MLRNGFEGAIRMARLSGRKIASSTPGAGRAASAPLKWMLLAMGAQRRATK